MDTQIDSFLNGRVRCLQPCSGYRSGNDAVFLASALDGRDGARLAEFGCGAGVASLCLAARKPHVTLFGVERVPNMAALAKENFKDYPALELIEKDLAHLTQEDFDGALDEIFFNPPYYPAALSASATPKSFAIYEETPLEIWIKTARKLLKDKGSMVMISRIEQLSRTLSALTGFGKIKVLPLSARLGRAPKRFLLSAQKGSKTPLEMLFPLILHMGTTHKEDQDDYSELARAILREGEAMDW